MFEMISRIYQIAGSSRKKITVGIVSGQEDRACRREAGTVCLSPFLHLKEIIIWVCKR